MNMPNHLPQNAYTNNYSKLQTASKETFKVIVDESRQAIRDAHMDIGVVPDKEGIQAFLETEDWEPYNEHMKPCPQILEESLHQCYVSMFDR